MSFGPVEFSWTLIAIGVFCLACSVGDWDFFFNNPRAAGYVALFGRKGARYIWGGLGATLIGIGVAIWAGLIQLPAPK